MWMMKDFGIALFLKNMEEFFFYFPIREIAPAYCFHCCKAKISSSPTEALPLYHRLMWPVIQAAVCLRRMGVTRDGMKPKKDRI